MAVWSAVLTENRKAQQMAALKVKHLAAHLAAKTEKRLAHCWAAPWEVPMDSLWVRRWVRLRVVTWVDCLASAMAFVKG